MERTTNDGRTVIVVSHDLAAVQRLCNRSLLLERGQIVADSKTDEVIRHYVSRRLDERSVYEQPSNKQKAINLRRVFLANSHGTPLREFRYDERITLVIEYEVNSAMQDCCVWFGLRTMQDILAFGSSDIDVDASMLGERRPGYYRTSVALSESWLNAGQYFTVIGITKYNPLQEFDRVEALSFTILDVGTPERLRTGNFRPGILQPLMAWTTYPAEDQLGLAEE